MFSELGLCRNGVTQIRMGFLPPSNSWAIHEWCYTNMDPIHLISLQVGTIFINSVFNKIDLLTKKDSIDISWHALFPLWSLKAKLNFTNPCRFKLLVNPFLPHIILGRKFFPLFSLLFFQFVYHWPIVVYICHQFLQYYILNQL